MCGFCSEKCLKSVFCSDITENCIMKKLIFCFLFLSLAWGVFAQQEEDAARKEMEERLAEQAGAVAVAA